MTSNLCYKHRALRNKGTPLDWFVRKSKESLVSAVRGVMNVYAEKSQLAVESSKMDRIIARESVGQEETRISSISDSYQKILDYHIAEIFLTTVAFGVIVLLRLHH